MVINIVVAGNLAAVVSVEFDDLREIVVYCIEFKVLFTTPFGCFRQSFPGAADLENQFVSISPPFLEVGDKRLIGLTAVWPFAVTESAIEIYGNGLEIDCCIIHGQSLLCMLPGWFSCMQTTDPPSERSNLKFLWRTVRMEADVPFQY